MKRLVLPLATAGLIGVTAAAGIWLGYSESALGTLAGLAESASGGHLKLEQPTGRLAGPLAFGRIAWQAPGVDVAIEQLRLDWSPGQLLLARLSITELAAARVAVDIAGSDEAGEVPASLNLPVAVDVEKIAISVLDYGTALTARDLHARFASDGRKHRLSEVRGNVDQTGIVAEMTLGGAAPLPVQASATLASQLAEQPVRLSLEASGPLERILLKISALEGVQGDAQVTLTPFARQAFAEAHLALADVDPAVWAAGAPQASLTLRAEVNLDEEKPGTLLGTFEVANSRPGPLDRQRLPLDKLSGHFVWNDDGGNLNGLEAALPGGGRLSGSGNWRDGALALALQARAVDALQLVSVLRLTRLNGPVSAQVGGERQQLSLRLSDARFALAGEASHENGRVELSRLELSAENARLQVSGTLDTNREMAFSASGELVRFDPARFAQVPAALLNGTFAASGRLRAEGATPGAQPRPVVEAQFVLRDSQLGGQPLTGRGDLLIDWPRIPRADLQLAAGPNRLTASGAFGRGGDSLLLDIVAPKLALYGLEGSLNGRLRLGGTLEQPTLAADLATPRLASPGIGQVKGGSLVADLGSRPDSPLKLEARVAVFDAVDRPQQLKNLDVRVDGTRRHHKLRVAGDIAGGNVLNLVAEGGLADAEWQWSGRLLEAGLVAEEKFRSFTLTQPAAVMLGATAWRAGPLLLAGEDWKLRLQADAGPRKLEAGLSGSGPRLGKIDGQFEATMKDAWTLDRQAPWRGSLHSEIADLAWVAELVGDDWRTGGRFDGELKLAGTPEKPLASGRFHGKELALTLPEQGMRLNNGELDARLDDNLLRVSKLAFDSPLQAPPGALRRAAGDALTEKLARPGRLEITGQMRVDRVTDGTTLDVLLDRVGVFQLHDQWVLVSGQSNISLAQEAFKVRGKLEVDAAFWQLAPIGRPRLSDDVVIKTADGVPPSALRPPLDLDLETRLGRNFYFRGLGLETRLAGNIRLRAEGRDLPRASGRIRTQGGRFEAYGQQLEIERGILTFQGLPDNPAIDARAIRRGLAVEAGVQISGTVQRPVVRLVSDPDVPDAEKLSWLVLGHGPDQGGSGAAMLLLSAAGGLLGNDSGSLVREIKQGFGIDEFGVRQGTLGDSGGRQIGSRVVGSSFNDTSGTSDQILTVGRRLSDNMLLSYEQALGRAGSVVKLTVNLNRQISVIARAGSDNALDAVYTLTFGEPTRRQRGTGSGR